MLIKVLVNMMNLRSVIFISSFVALLPFSSGQIQCCRDDVAVVNELSCERYGETSISCDDGELKLFPKKLFGIERNDDGQYVKNKENGSVTPIIGYCSGFKVTINDTPSKQANERHEPVIIACFKSAQFYAKGRWQVEIRIAIVGSIVSAILLAIAAFIYFVIPQTQDVEGQCTFHLTTNLGLAHFSFVYKIFWLKNLIRIDLIKNQCLPELYLIGFLILASFIWSSILSYHMWARFRNNVRFDESKLMFWYRLVGYGIPALLILLSNVTAHIYDLNDSGTLQWKCYIHGAFTYVFYVSIPVLIMIIVNAVFFIDLQRRLWNVYPLNSPDVTDSLIKKLQYKLITNAKLFFIMGLPWLILILVASPIFLLRPAALFWPDIVLFLVILISFQGMSIFFILVLGRKRVRQGLVDKFGIKGMRPSPDMEASEESNFEDKNENAQELNIRANSPAEC